MFGMFFDLKSYEIYVINMSKEKSLLEIRSNRRAM